jgi:hypothetical protein
MGQILGRKIGVHVDEHAVCAWPELATICHE